MFQELEGLQERYRLLLESLTEPAVLANPQRLRELTKEKAELEPLVRAYEDRQRALEELKQSEDILADARADLEFRKLAETERAELRRRLDRLEDEIKALLMPRDPRDEKDVILEIRAGAGGDESSLFAQDLFRMYARFAESQGWKVEVLGTSLSPVGGIKEAVLNIRGKKVFSRLKFESGVHRVQRVPKTEASGRIHTSTATVAVLPEADELDVKIDPKDLRIEAFGASGPGGQSVNRNYTAIRVTHRPSGLVVSCQDEKSQHRNKEKALRILRSRLMDIAEQEQHSRISSDRRSQVGTGDRSEKIRTYNFPQSRVTDHRLGQSLHNLQGILDGELAELIEKLTLFSQASTHDARRAV
ncbi:MAG: peptide chain release factor 1 [Candidatus Aminicenantes bacterium RBG_13_63_10]|nr:MAG: peptide chain release factor 1 [Candidatus Aminicenantes bacterium RBG_13_63_10]